MSLSGDETKARAQSRAASPRNDTVRVGGLHKRRNESRCSSDGQCFRSVPCPITLCTTFASLLTVFSFEKTVGSGSSVRLELFDNVGLDAHSSARVNLRQIVLEVDPHLLVGIAEAP